jgi:FkbH-like protein
MVAVPEVPEDPALVPQVLADAGYFESVVVTSEDRERTQQYQANQQRDLLKATSTDMEGYLRGLEMRMLWRRFDSVGLNRTVQLINKTNQFNLTTRRYTEEDIKAIMQDPSTFGLQLRLIDRFGDNGIIGIVIGKLKEAKSELFIDTWLMSCRVLGRQVESTTLNLIAKQARAMGATRLVGDYVPTKKNGMVKDHYERLGFTVVERDADGRSSAVLDLGCFVPVETFIKLEEG